ncbi:PTS lactose/cellobiose transporter subunit IIA [Maledivibacter halophilus]|uniref:PTS system lichenan oligosaccharide-specific IIA component, Lac family (TC 4.A.3.2.2) n=1 Tax=Maledivibacter halophilus TaxID=36842 RepID=A0A1T5K039_9FIRM|nr:PTS lactose/cellobiose transporter subunit IIA [Maledivibacter halophilus]SKC56839.1 PTS system lichenan oligosaccharide-specific IIA component, Lac family (TC 4.A.3.2.2) [Maledivibacter halophilus]
MNYEEKVINLIIRGGNARSLAMDAIEHAKNNDIKAARKALEEAGEELSQVHNIQTDFIQKEAAGNGPDITLLMIHAQDHLMNAMTVKDMATEFVNLYEKMHLKECL